MSLDIYVGPLCRLYSREFTPDSAQSSPGTMPVAADGAPLTVTPAAEVLPAILGWRRLITPQFRSAGVTVVDWTEAPTATIKSSRVGWDSYWSLRLLAAYSEFPHLHLPDAAPQDLSADPALTILRDHFLRSRFPHLHACDLWVPPALRRPRLRRNPHRPHQARRRHRHPPRRTRPDPHPPPRRARSRSPQHHRRRPRANRAHPRGCRDPRRLAPPLRSRHRTPPAHGPRRLIPRSRTHPRP